MVINDVTSKSHEQRLITKEHIATNLIILFKWLYIILYSGTTSVCTLVINFLKV